MVNRINVKKKKKKFLAVVKCDMSGVVSLIAAGVL